jgi:hypothetical protein
MYGVTANNQWLVHRGVRPDAVCDDANFAFFGRSCWAGKLAGASPIVIASGGSDNPKR